MFVGSYGNCRWCNGRGCNQCDIEREKEIDRPMLRIKFEKDENGNPYIPEEGMELLRAFSRENVVKAFSEGGGGHAEIEQKLKEIQIAQAVRQLGALLRKPEQEKKKED